ncbi:MAG: MEKHLA domain-containing protein [Sphingomonas sp.]
MTTAPLPPHLDTADMRSRLELIASSYQRLTGRKLAPPAGDMAHALWTAPRVIVAHGTEGDPIFFFGNRAALEQFEMSLERFAAMPSRLSAEPMLRDERKALLDRVARDGFIEDVAGIRISATGRRFHIERATVWNLIDEHGSVHGQAATFDCRSESAPERGTR